MSRKTWYQGLIYLVVFLYISTVWIAGSENGSGSLEPLSLLFDIPKYGFICWFLWKIQERKLNVEGLVGLAILSFSQFIHSLLLFYLSPNKSIILASLFGICFLSTSMLLRKVELKQLLVSWKTRRSWQTGTCFLGLALATFELSTNSLYFAVPSYVIIQYFLAFAFNVAVVLLFLLLMTKEDLRSLKLYSTILLLLCSVKTIGYLVQPYDLSSTVIFYLLLSIYQVCRVNGVFDQYAIEGLAENGSEEVSETSEIKRLKSDDTGDEVITESPEQSECQADSDNDPKGLSLNSPWLWTSLAIAVLSLSFLFLALMSAGSYAILYLAFTFLFHGLYLIATILLWLGMKRGRTRFLSAAMVFFGLSVFVSRSPVSILLVILIWIGSRESEEESTS